MCHYYEGINNNINLDIFSNKDMGCCAGSSDQGRTYVPTHGIIVKALNKPLLGKPNAGTQAVIDMMAGMNLKPEDMVFTEENIAQKRAMSGAMVAPHMQMNKHVLDAVPAKVETTTFEIKSTTDGAMIKVLMNRPKELTDKSGPAIIWARGGGAVILQAEDFNPSDG